MKPRLVYIKLGTGSMWANECIEKGRIRIGFEELPRAIFETENPETIRAKYIELKVSNRAADIYRSQLKIFFEADENMVWITFHQQKLWWCRAQKGYVYDADGTKYKNVIGEWSDKDIHGNTLWEDNLSGALLKTKSYLSTLCVPGAADYAWDKINCLQSKEAKEFENDLAKFKSSTIGLIRRLRPDDFEVLIDLVFRNAGYQRLGVVGKNVKTIDLSLLHPLSNEKILVQIKSAAALKIYTDWKEKVIIKNSDATHYYFVVHSPAVDLAAYEESGENNFSLWREKELSDMVIRFGLIDWLLQKAG